MYQSEHIGTGQIKHFHYRFPIFQKADVRVRINDQILPKNAYSIQPNTNLIGGKVFLAAAPADGATVLIFRKIEKNRAIDYQLAGKIDPEQLNSDFNYLSECMKELEEQGPGITQPGTGGTGPQGAQGATGAQGERGYQGYQGATGGTGPQGADGAAGPQGAPGTVVAGENGGFGPQGPQGPQGATGTTGERGFQGYQGTAGSNGATGPQGFQGVQGAPAQSGGGIGYPDWASAIEITPLTEGMTLPHNGSGWFSVDSNAINVEQYSQQGCRFIINGVPFNWRDTWNGTDYPSGTNGMFPVYETDIVVLTRKSDHTRIRFIPNR
ncbi:MAG: collagen-like protein [Rickettsiales bacterium]|nr:collagen-like protein [Rickettsiales bacterium]